ncbi:MAG: c-type cytochrome [Gemmatimonadetes bacterium]|nr:c-type cytochrome [Gemmatimonadota bacterium]
MTKRQTRAFFYAGTGVFGAIFIALTIDSHRQFPTLTHSDRITPAVIAGKHVWHRQNCVNCHTLLGEGAYFAPDLTKITQQRGAAYLKAFLKDPSKFYSEERDRRLMPTLALSDREIDELIAFLDWVGRIDTQGWPPRPILVTGAAIPGTEAVGAPPRAAASSDPVALGEALFRRTPPGCSACHSTAPGVNVVGPSLANAATVAAQRVESPDYHGKATDAAGYLRESILDPNAYVVQGPTFSSGGRSLMPSDFAQTLEPRQVDELVAYLMTLR